MLNKVIKVKCVAYIGRYVCKLSCLRNILIITQNIILTSPSNFSA